MRLTFGCKKHPSSSVFHGLFLVLTFTCNVEVFPYLDVTFLCCDGFRGMLLDPGLIGDSHRLGSGVAAASGFKARWREQPASCHKQTIACFAPSYTCVIKSPPLKASFFWGGGLRPNAGHGLLILEVPRSHTMTHYIR